MAAIGARPKHLQRHRDEFVYRFDRRWREGGRFGSAPRCVVWGQLAAPATAGRGPRATVIAAFVAGGSPYPTGAISGRRVDPF
jgi:hypothetical protein